MKSTLEDYYHDLDEKAERFAQAEEMRERDDHLQAFNFGRIAQRIEGSRSDVWRRAGWVLAGLAIGVACGSAFPDYLCPALALRFLNKTSLLVQGMRKSTFRKLSKTPHLQV